MFGEIQINVFPVLPDNKNDRNCTEMNNLLVCSHSLPGKIEWINVKMNDVTMYGRSALFFCDVFVRKWGPRPRTSSRCYHSNKSAATFKKGIFVHPPWVPNCMQNLKEGWKFSFPKILDSYRDFFLRSLIVTSNLREIYELFQRFFKEYLQWILSSLVFSCL